VLAQGGYVTHFGALISIQTDMGNRGHCSASHIGFIPFVQCMPPTSCNASYASTMHIARVTVLNILPLNTVSNLIVPKKIVLYPAFGRQILEAR